MKHILAIIIILLCISTDAACQTRWKVGDSVDLEEMKVYCHRKIARQVDLGAPEFNCLLPSGKTLTNDNTKGKLLVFVLWNPARKENKEMLPTRPSTVLCPIQDLASKDTNLLLMSIIPDTNMLAQKNKPCFSGTIPYALAPMDVMRRLCLGLGHQLILIIGKDGNIVNAVCGFDLIFYDDKSYALLAETIKKLLG